MGGAYDVTGVSWEVVSFALTQLTNTGNSATLATENNMTTAQRKQHKLGNQMRKLEIIRRGHTLYMGGVIQDGKYTPQAKNLFGRIMQRLGMAQQLGVKPV